jgi:FAD/FMN-containing dehydrogenase
MSRACLQLVTDTYPQQRAPFATLNAPWYVLLEISDAEDEAHATARLESVLGDALEAGEIGDVAIAQNIAQTRAMWQLRESITLALAEDGKCLKHDVSLPVSTVPDFVESTDAVLQARFPGVRNFTFGHLGDGNLHYNVARPAGADDATLHAVQPGLSAIVHDAVQALGGSISAEQGIGRVRTADLARYKQPVELRLMRAVKRAIDPQGLMNPGVLLP